MQTLLYVIGPFLALGGVGVGALWVAGAFISKVLVPKQRLLQAEVVKIKELNEYAFRASNVVNHMIVNSEQYALDERQSTELCDLRALPVHDKIQSIPPKHRRAIGEMQ